MRNLWWICWYLWKGLPTIFAFPIDYNRGTGDSWSSYWELKWPQYAIGTLGFVVVALTLAGCTCCRRQRRPKGFQDDAGNGKEFKDGSTAATDTTIERVPSSNLELEVSRIPNSESSISKVQFEALPVDQLVGSVRPAKPKPPSSSLFSDDSQTPENTNFSRDQSSRDWFAGNFHVPRERLKYLREIGRGWFGKVVEGTAEIPDNSEKKNRGVVVRILTEEATNSEKNWFLGEATPYLKLCHPNILTLLGSCLETDPYLLLFESCPAGDLKGFLRGNRDKGTCDTLKKENVPTRFALDIANALEHMHDNGFAHTDLSARNCLVAPDLSAKLGDYGTGVEKYPEDYYVVGDRALPIRWSAPESLDCTETTIETRTITPRANLWSFAVFLWEIATWGERPFDDLVDEQVIQMIFSLKTSFFAQRTCEILLKRLREEFDAPQSFREAIEASWKFLPDDRANLKESKKILRGIEDFEKRWKNLKPNIENDGKERDDRSASLQDLRGSVNEKIWDDENPIQAKFRLGPEEPVKDDSRDQNFCLTESGSETEEESWRGRVERGVYTEKVKQKSKSVADLMILVHIDSDSDAEASLGPQITDKIIKKRLPASGSDGDLRSHNFDDEFDEAIRKLRDNSVGNVANSKIMKNQSENLQLVDNIEKPKVMTLTNQGQTPILRLCFGTGENVGNSIFHDDDLKNGKFTNDSRGNPFGAFSDDEKVAAGFDNGLRDDKLTKDKFGDDISRSGRKILTQAKIEGPVLRLLSKGDSQLPVLSFVPEVDAMPQESLNIEESSRFESFLVFETPKNEVDDFSNNFEPSSSHKNSKGAGEDSLDVELWNNALAYELEKKNPGFHAHERIFDESIELTQGNAKETPKKSISAPNTPKIVNFRLEENLRQNFAASAPETPSKNDFQTKIDGKSSEQVNRYKNDSKSIKSTSSSGTSDKYNLQPGIAETGPGNYLNTFPLPETPEKRLLQSQIEEKSSNNEDKLVDTCLAVKTPEKHYSDSKDRYETSQNVNQPLGSSSTWEISEKSKESSENGNRPLGSLSAPETPAKNYFVSKTKEKGSQNVNRLLSSSSVPETPEKHYFQSEIDETNSKPSYYQNLPLGSSSAPETPGNHYFASKIDGKSPKNMNYYPDLLGSTSAPETPQFRGNYVAGNLDDDSSASEKMPKGSDTPQSRGNYSVGNGDEDSFTGEDLDNAERIIKRSLHEVDDEEDRKHLSTPDDERSSDSGFRDKESCEEEESPVPCPSASSIISGAGISSSGLPANSSPLSASAEEEQMRILFELDTILDAEYYGTFRDSERLDDSEIFSPNSLQSREIDSDIVSAKNRSISESLESTESTEVVETVRANSCEPDFLGSRKLRGISTLTNEEDEEKIGGEDLKKLGDFLKSEAEDCDNFVVAGSDDTEADFLGDSASESLKNLDELSGNLRKDSGDFSTKNDSKNWDYSTDIRRLNLDSSSDGKYDKSYGSNDFSIELRSFDTSDISKSKMTDSDSGSPIKSEKISGIDCSIEERTNTDKISHMERKTGDSGDFVTAQNSEHNSLIKSGQSEKDSEICEDPIDFENTASNSPLKSEKKNKPFEICEALQELEKSSSNSLLKTDRSSQSSEICEVLVELEKSGSDSSVKSEKNSKTSELCEALAELENSASNSSIKSGKNSRTSELCEASVEFENSTSSSPFKSEKGNKSSEINEVLVQSKNSASNSPSKSEKTNKTSEICEVSIEFDNPVSNSPLKSEKCPGTPEKSEAPPKFEKPFKTLEISELSTDLGNSSSNSPEKSSKPTESLENFEAPQEFDNSVSASSKKISKSQKASESSEDSAEFDNSAATSPKKISKPHKTSEASETSAESHNSSSTSPKKIPKPQKTSEQCEASSEFDNSFSASPQKVPRPLESSDACEASETDIENSPSESPIKTDRNPTSDLSMETRGPESVHSDVDQWSSRENINENENDDEDSSTMSLRSDNSYVSFGLDEEFVAAIRNELREKLPRAQMPVIETLDPRDEKQPSINKDAESKRWEEEDAEENAERGSGSVDIAIRYNIYGTPLSPILEERESAGTSESLVSKDDSRDDASIASRVSALSEDLLVVDTRTNKAMMLEANSTGNGHQIEPNPQVDDDRDTSHGDFSDEENLEYPQNHLNRGLENKRISMGSGGAPLPSPEEESKWQQQFPLPLQMQDDLMSTSFGTDRDWDSQDDDEGEEGEDGEEEDEEENSSSSGEFVWKRYDESHGDLENVATRSPPNKPKSHEPEADLEEEGEGDEDDDEEEEEFTPSAWDATLAPHRSALRSPEKTLKSGDQKKSVWFKKQRYHCVYEYPKETPVVEGQGQAATTWEPTSYADWEEMMDEPRLDVYPIEYDESNRAGDEEFYVSSSNRPFQFQSGEGKYVSQFFPGASSTLLQQQQQQPQQLPSVPTMPVSEDGQESQDEVDRVEPPSSPHFLQPNGNSRIPDFTETQQYQQQQLQQTQLGELRHTRDRLKLNLLTKSGSSKTDEDTIENRASETEMTENRASETEMTENRASETEMTENRTSETETTENADTKSPKTFETTLSSENREKTLQSEKSIDPQFESKESENSENALKKMPETEETSADGFATTEKVISTNLAVKNAPEAPIYDKQNEKLASDDRQSISADNCEDNEKNIEKELIDDIFTVIKAEDEVLAAKNYSESIGDQKKSSELPIISTSEATVEKIVDIPKLETEESPESSTDFGDENRREVTTETEMARQGDEKIGINVQSSKS